MKSLWVELIFCLFWNMHLFVVGLIYVVGLICSFTSVYFLIPIQDAKYLIVLCLALCCVR